MLEPITFPSASWEFPFLAAITLVANSGKEVPSATANNATKALEMPKIAAILIAESTRRFPPKGSNKQPNKNKSIVKKIEDLVVDLGESSLIVAVSDALKNKYKEAKNSAINISPLIVDNVVVAEINNVVVRKQHTPK